MALLSLCVLAKDEQAFIGACLSSARAVADEIVLVDTGSSDRTPQIARDLGARVFSAEWPGEFAAAYDLPLAHARSEWILVLDGDEALDPRSAEGLRPFLARADADGYILTIRNYWYRAVAQGRRCDPRDPWTRGAWNYNEHPNLRLFRNRREFRYQGKVHQSLGPSILRHGGRIERGPFLLHHWGPLRVQRNEAKRPSYARLAEAKVQDEPLSAQAHFELGGQSAEIGDLERALAHFLRAREMGFGRDAGYRVARTLDGLGRHREAIPCFRESLSQPRQGQVEDADIWDGLATAWRNAGDPSQAEGACRRAVEARPENPGSTLNLATLLCGRGAFAEAIVLVDRVLAELPGASEPWILRGAVRLQEGDASGAREAFERALDIEPGNAAARANLALVSASPRESEPTCPADAVVSLVDVLDGGAGRLAVDIVLGLRPRPQLVLCRDSGRYHRNGLAEELIAAGIPVIQTSDPREVLHRTRPRLVLHHWTGGEGAMRAAKEPWIAVGHSALPMAEGYDEYVVFTEFQAGYQGRRPVRRIAPGISRREDGRGGGGIIAVVAQLDRGKFPRRFLAYLPSPAAVSARVRIAGGGALRYEIEPEAPQVEFVGRLASREVPHFLADADLGLVLTETYEDAVPVALLEMLSLGIRVVAKPWGAIPEFVVPGKNGFLAETEEEFRGRVEECLRDPRRHSYRPPPVEEMQRAFAALVDEFRI